MSRHAWACMVVLCLLMVPAVALGQTVSFRDGQGAPASAYAEKGQVFVRVEDPAANTSPAPDTVTVGLATALAGDVEPLTLTETGGGTGVFAGSIRLGTSGAQPGVLETAADPGPPVVRDTITASYGAATATASLVGSFTEFRDTFGRAAGAFAPGETVVVRVTDFQLNNPLYRDSLTITVAVPATGEQESVNLQETGFDTGVFQGSLPTGTASIYSGDGMLAVASGDAIEAVHPDSDVPTSSRADATIGGSDTELVDAQGQPAVYFLEGTRAYLRVVDGAANLNPGLADSAQVLVSADLSGDQETVYLQETGPNTGVFTGWIALRRGAGIPGNSVLETSETTSPPYRFDTVRASHADAAGTSTDAVDMLGSLTFFLDAFGNEVTRYAAGANAYVRVEDHNANVDPTRFDTTVATVQSLTSGDAETLQLLEIAKDSGVFQGFVPTSGNTAPANGDGYLAVQADERIQAMHVDANGLMASGAEARIDEVSVLFIDEAGRPTVELLNGGLARVRVIAPGFNTDPYSANNFPGEIRTRYGADLEFMQLTETGANTGVFEGSIRMHATDVGNVPGGNNNGVLDTHTSGEPEYRGDEVTVSTGPFSATATVIPGRIVYLDAFGRETTTFAVGATVRVRVTDHTRNVSGLIREDFTVYLSVPCTTDDESVLVRETGFDTGVFEGAINSSASGSFGDGALRGAPGCTIEARSFLNYTPTPAFAQARFSGSELLFVDAQGQPASVYMEGTRAYLRVVNHSLSGSVPVMVSAELSGDLEQVYLTETSPGSGVFEGWIGLRRASQGIQQNSILETSEAQGPPHEFETLRASFFDPQTSETATATATTLNFRVWFIDAYGRVVTSYAQGSRVYVRVEDHNFNDPNRYDVLGVTVRSAMGDEEPLQLLETGGKESGIYEGSILLSDGPVAPGDGRLQAQAGGEIEARRDGQYNAAPAVAQIDEVSVLFIDEAGRPTVELLNGGLARVRVIAPGFNTDPYSANGIPAEIRTRYGADLEFIQLTETGANTGVFEGSIRMHVTDVGNVPGANNNGVLDTHTSGEPEYRGDEVTVTSGPFSATANVIAARIVYLDAFGRETATFTVGSTVRVRVTDHTRNVSGLYREDFTVYLSVPCTTDDESVLVRETGFDTGVFEGAINSSASGSFGDGALKGAPGCVIEARSFLNYTPNPAFAQARFSGSELLFVDAQGQPASVYMEGTRAYLRVVNHSLSGSVPVMVSAELSGDQEQVYLTETSPGSGVFEAWISLRRASQGISQNYILETSEAQGPPHEFETLRASFFDPQTSETATATATTLNFRVWFIDAYGRVVTSYAQGSRVYVRVEDHNFNDPNRYDTLGVTVRSSTGDEEPLQLLEAGGKESGIYEGSLLLSESLVAPGDGRLQAQSGAEIEARRDGQYNESPAVARIDEVSILFIDEAGRPTVELLNGGLARVRLIAPGFNTDPYSANNLPAEIRTRYGADLEFMQLTETGANTGVFEGSIRMHATDVGNVPGGNNNGVLDTHTSGEPEYRGDEVTVTSGPFSAMANVIAARIVYLDAFGRETTTFAVGSTVRVRVTDHTRNVSGFYREDFSVYLSVPCTTDDETVLVRETNFDTGIFEGAINSSASGSFSDGLLKGAPGCVIEARSFLNYTPTPAFAQARFSGSELLFVDAQGQPASVYMEGTRAYLRVVNHSLSGSVPVMVSAELSGDQEQVYLTETVPGSGVFEGWIGLRRASQGIPQNYVLETWEAQDYPPHEFETLRASFFDPQTSETASATATTLTFRVWFIDAYGRVVTSYAQNSRAYVRVEDHNFNDPTRYDTLGVTVRSAMGDEEPLQLLETGGKESGIYEGSIPLSYGPVTPGDGRLQAQTDGDIEARRDGQYNAAPAVARIDGSSIGFIDEAGRPTLELLNGGLARVRVEGANLNGNPNGADTIPVEIRTRYGADLEYMQLTETGPDTGVFEGSIRMHATDVGGAPGAGSNGVLDTRTSGEPEYRGDEVTVTNGPYSATATVIPGRIVFLDAYGRETTSFVAGSTVRVRVTDHTRNLYAAYQEDFSAYLTSPCTGDQEMVLVRETGFDTGVFEGSVNSRSQPGSWGDGTLQGAPGCAIEAYHYTSYIPAAMTAQARFTGSALLFVDAQGQPASVYLEGTRAYIRVVDHSSFGPPPVTIFTELSGDQEMVYLSPTSPGSGIFEGWIPLRRSPSGNPGNSVLETYENPGPPHEFETLRASLFNPQTNETATVTATTRNFNVWFADAYGGVVTSYAQGSRVYVRMEDHNFNDPGFFDQAVVTVRSATGDEETVQMLETGNDTSIFQGSILMAAGPVAPGDYRLQAQPGTTIEARREGMFNAAPAVATIEPLAIEFIDAAGRPTRELLSGDLARVRVFSLPGNFSPGTAETLSIEVRSLYGNDVEQVQLTETGPDTSTFEGSIPLFTTDSNGSTVANNGRLETHTGPYPDYENERVTASAGPISVQGRVAPSRVVFIDATGKEVSTILLGGPVRLRVVDAAHNFSSGYVDNLSLNLATACGDQEWIALTETGSDTGVFEGDVQSSASPAATYDGVLQGTAGCEITATHYNAYSPTQSEARARFTGSELRFIDAQGQPASVFLESTRAYIRLKRPMGSWQETVEVTADITGDREWVTLTETAPGSGTFEGSLPLTSYGSYWGDGSLQTGVLFGPPFQYETIRGRYFDGATNETSTATASTVGYRIEFLDADGAVTDAYAQGTRAYVRLEEHTYNNPTFVNRLYAVMGSEAGDQEYVELTETGVDTSIYEGSIALASGPTASADGQLQAQAGTEITADRQGAWFPAPARARIEGATIRFIDETGRTLLELVEGQTARMRVVSPSGDVNPGSAESITAILRSLRGTDQESVTLTETGPSTGVFEGFIQLAVGPLSFGNGRLETAADDAPDEVTASYGPYSTKASVINARLSYLDVRGRVTTTYPRHSAVRMRVEDARHNWFPGQVETIQVYLQKLDSPVDSETLIATETGPDTGVFEGSMPSNDVSGYDDGMFTGSAGAVAHASYMAATYNVFLTADATFLGNIAPIARDDIFNVTSSQGEVLPVTANDNDPDGLIAGVSAVTQGTQGTVTLDYGVVTYTPNPGATGQDTFTYVVSDYEAAEATATVTVVFNRPPVANDDTATVDEDGSVVIPVLANDNDPEGGSLRFGSYGGGAAHGTVTLNGDYTLTYTPAANYHGPDSFTYTIADAADLTATATVTITVNSINDVPVAGNDTLTQQEDTVGYVYVLDNDTDADGDTLSITNVSAPSPSGSATFLPDLRMRYVPVNNFNGVATFSYTVSDGHGGTATATVTVTVTPDNDLPVANADSVTLAEDTNILITVLANDTDPDGDTLSVTSVQQGAHGGVSLFPNGQVRYTPVLDYNGPDSFTYTISDGHGGTATATVNVTVTPVNDGPRANADSATVAEDGNVNINVLANDTDAENDFLSVSIVTQPAHGTVVVNADRTIKYTPAANYNGPDTFNYRASDGNATSTNVVTITVTPVPDAPVAVNDTATMVEDGTTVIDVVANDTDADGDALTVVSFSAPTFGTASITLDNKIRFTPNPNFFGPAFFTYTVADPSGRTATATIQVNVTAVNDAPVAVNDTTTVAEDGTVNVSVLANDNDPDFDTLTVTAVTQGAHGTVAINPDKTVKYTPAANYNGPDSFTYTISDGTVTATATVSVTVTAVNDAPAANADSATVAEDGSVDIPVLANDTDVDGNPLTVSSVTQGTNGTVSVNADNTVRYVPAANYSGSDSFTYTISDGNGGSATATVSVTVTSANDAPVANADSATVAEDGNVNVAVLGNDTDADGDTLTVSSVTQGTHGTVAINPDKTVKYTPAANYNGSDSFTYTVSDGNGGSATATVSVTVTSVNDAPVANADSATVAEDGSVNVTVLGNDTDADGDTLTVSAVTQGAHGTVSINPDKTVRYVPAANYSGADSFTYTVSDGTATATATVSINVTSVNDTPIANADSITVAEDGAINAAVLANDTDPEGDTLSVTAVTQGAKGTVSINPDKTVRYVPAANANGADSFTYTISDGNGGTATATVTVTITPVNDPPVAVNDTAVVQAGGSVIVSVLGNDSDIDSASLTVTSVTQGTRGTVAINANGTVTYTASMFVGADSFTYTVSDGNGGTATATVNVTLTKPGRVSSGIQAFYDFGEGSGSTVADTSGVGTPLNLTISNTAAVTWLPGALSINAETILASAGAATKVNNAVKASNAVTLEAWVAADNLTQTGPARLVSIAKNGTQRNVLFGQSANRWEAQLKTSSTTATLQSPANSVGLTLTHVVYVRNSSGQAYIYIDGTQSATQATAGNLSGWDATYKLALANEVSGGKVWLGDLYMVAIYGRALSAAEVQQNFLAGGN